jgi:hypothetical protein
MLPLTFGTKRAGPKTGTRIRLERLLGASPITSRSAPRNGGPRHVLPLEHDVADPPRRTLAAADARGLGTRESELDQNAR